MSPVECLCQTKDLGLDPGHRDREDGLEINAQACKTTQCGAENPVKGLFSTLLLGQLPGLVLIDITVDGIHEKSDFPNDPGGVSGLVGLSNRGCGLAQL